MFLTALALSATAAVWPVPSHDLVYVKIESGMYKVYREDPKGTSILYSEPYDQYEISGMDPVIAELWPSPDGQAFAFLRHTDGRSTRGPDDQTRLCLYSASARQRTTLFAQDALPTLSQIRLAGFLTWEGNEGIVFVAQGRGQGYMNGWVNLRVPVDDAEDYQRVLRHFADAEGAFQANLERHNTDEQKVYGDPYWFISSNFAMKAPSPRR